MGVKIKICGLCRAEDIRFVNAAHPDYVGFVMAKSRRQVSPEQVRNLTAGLNPAIQTVGVFVNEKREVIAKYLQSGLIDIAQLHGQETREDVLWLKEQTGKPIIKAISVKTQEDVLQWQESAAAYLLLDNGAGGSGEVFDWSRIPAGIKPFFMAGGIGLHNLDRALEFNPYGVDISSGVETEGIKDEEKIFQAVKLVRDANR